MSAQRLLAVSSQRQHGDMFASGERTKQSWIKVWVFWSEPSYLSSSYNPSQNIAGSSHKFFKFKKCRVNYLSFMEAEELSSANPTIHRVGWNFKHHLFQLLCFYSFSQHSLNISIGSNRTWINQWRLCNPSIIVPGCCPHMPLPRTVKNFQ